MKLYFSLEELYKDTLPEKVNAKKWISGCASYRDYFWLDQHFNRVFPAVPLVTLKWLREVVKK